MGREIKRVPLDFSWPIGETWKGFLNPYWKHRSECPDCGGRGYAPDANRLFDQWYGYAYFRPRMTGSTLLLPDDPYVSAFAARNVEQMSAAQLLGFYGTADRATATHLEGRRLCDMWNRQWMHHLDQDDVNALVAAGRLWDFTRRPRTEEQAAVVKERLAAGHNSWLPEDNGYVPTAAEVNQWSLRGLGHDSLNCSICVRAKCERLGHQEYCATCEGDGDSWDSPESKERYEGWKKQEPPAGEGWQLWETVSEGSPVSPVFPSTDTLAAWMVTEQGYSPQAAKAFCERGWAPSLVMVPGVYVADGVTAAGILKAGEYEHEG